MKTVFFYILTILVIIFVLAWLFNHVNAWVSIAVAIVAVYYFLTHSNKFIK